MIDYDADQEMLDAIIEASRRSESAATNHELERQVKEADEQGLIHSAIFGRAYLAAALMESNIDDVASVLGVLAEAQHLVREHQAELNADVFEPIAVQTQGVLLYLREHSRIPLDKIEKVRAQYEQMCRQHGLTLRGAYALSTSIAIGRGDHAAAERFLTLWQAQPRAWYVIYDTVDDAIEWYTYRGKYDEAMSLYERATPEGEGRYYAGVQLTTVLAALRSGQAEMAAQLYDESLDPDDIDSGDSARLTYLALVGRLDEGLALLPTVAKPTPTDTDRSKTFLAENAAVLLGHAAAAGRGSEQVVGMDGDVDELLARYRAAADRTARTLDQVNNMDAAIRRLQGFWDLFGPGTAGSISDPQVAADPATTNSTSTRSSK